MQEEYNKFRRALPAGQEVNYVTEGSSFFARAVRRLFGRTNEELELEISDKWEDDHKKGLQEEYRKFRSALPDEQMIHYITAGLPDADERDRRGRELLLQLRSPQGIEHEIFNAWLTSYNRNASKYELPEACRWAGVPRQEMPMYIDYIAQEYAAGPRDKVRPATKLCFDTVYKELYPTLSFDEVKDRDDIIAMQLAAAGLYDPSVSPAVREKMAFYEKLEPQSKLRFVPQLHSAVKRGIDKSLLRLMVECSVIYAKYLETWIKKHNLKDSFIVGGYIETSTDRSFTSFMDNMSSYEVTAVLAGEAGHACALVACRWLRLVYYFDPNGVISVEGEAQHIEDYRKAFKRVGWSFESNCLTDGSTEFVGPQSLEHKHSNLTTSCQAGYCGSWAMLFIQACLQNPQVDPRVVAAAISRDALKPEMSSYLRQFASHVENVCAKGSSYWRQFASRVEDKAAKLD